MAVTCSRSSDNLGVDAESSGHEHGSGARQPGFDLTGGERGEVGWLLWASVSLFVK